MKDMRERIVMYYIGILTIIASFAIVLIAAYWSFYPYKVFELKSPAIPDEKIYKNGDVIYYEVDYCKYKDLPANVAIQFIDGVIYTMPLFQTRNPVGCHKTKGTILTPNLPAGIYRLHVTYTYQVNPIRIVQFVYETGTFQIVK